MKHNKDQKNAIEHGDGALLIVAGAGTGKTTVITERIRHLIVSKKASPNEILALTFTEKAAKEMEDRIDLMMPYGYSNMWILTFHSFCDRILRDESLAIGLDPNFKLLSFVESIHFLKKNIFEFDLEYFRPLGRPDMFLTSLLAHFSRLQDEDILPTDYLDWVNLRKPSRKINSSAESLENEKWLELAKAYKKFEVLKMENSFLDFGDLIIKTLDLFRSRPNVLDIYRKKFKYFLIDEYQDTNIAQNELIKALAGENGNVTIVADDDQSIYKWRGASVSNIVQFRMTFPKTKIITLNKNYRSDQKILDSAYRLIQNNNPDRLEVVEKIDKSLQSQIKYTNSEVNHVEVDRVEQEVDYVVNKISDLVNGDYTFKDIAILVRANDHADPFIRSLEKHGIPHQFLGPSKLFRKPEIVEIVSYLKVLSNPEDSLSMYKLLSIKNFDISQEDIITVLNYSKKKNVSIYQSMSKLESISIDKVTKKKIQKIVDLISSHQKEINIKTAGEILYLFMHDAGILSEIINENDAGSFEKMNNYARFFDKLKTFEMNEGDANIFRVIDWIDLHSSEGESSEFLMTNMIDQDFVSVMTVHGSKGLEFPVVFLVNMVEGRFPSINRKEKIPIPEELIKEILPSGDSHVQEERRLAYVGITRAKEKVIMTSAKYYGEAKRIRKTSVFVGEALDKINSGDEKKINSISNSTKVENRVNIDLSSKNHKIKVDYLSYSQIQTFNYCPLHYKLNYILRIPTPQTESLSFGISIHDTLDDFYKLVIDGKNPSHQDLLHLLRKNWRDEGYLNKKHEEKMLDQGVEYMREYYKNEYKPDIKTLTSEQVFKISLKPLAGNYLRIVGTIDRIDDLGNGKIEIIDYKTGDKIPTEKEVEKDLQLKFYAIASTHSDFPFSHDPKDILLSLYYFKIGKKISTKKSKKEIEEAVREIYGWKEKIETSDFKCLGEFYCQNCEFSQYCDH